MKRAGYVSPREAADMSGLSERQVWRKLSDDSLPHEKVGGRVWIALADVPARKVDPLDELRAELEDVKRRLADLEKRRTWSLGAFNGQSDALPASDVQPYQPDALRPLVAPLSASRHDTSENGEIPAHSERCTTFAKRHRLVESTARRWAVRQSEKNRRELVIIRPDPRREDGDSHPEIWLTPEGQDALLAALGR